MHLKIIKLTIFLLCFLICPSIIKAAKSPDAIAIRVIPNTEHYSPMRWYKEQGFTGSPQTLTIDGYQAIRDGRTVYVNAANIGVDSTLYTNIYLMSYNQDAEEVTIKIVNEMLSHWHFNRNITDSGQCVDANGNLGNGCLTDADCSAQGGSAFGGQYCQSPKAKITRDTRRLSDLAEIKIALADYKQTNNKYPVLTSGSYLPGKSLSVWPSWRETLEKELWASLPNDPINRLGTCEGYDPATCWSEQTKKFADSDPVDPELNLPDCDPEDPGFSLSDCSRAYVYAAKDSGAGYKLCAVMESGLLTTLEVGACAESEMTAQFSASSENSPPQITGVNLPQAESGPSYQGFIQATDPDGDPLVWTLAIVNCPLWNNLRLENTGVASQKKIIADNAGQAGTCQITITIDDKREAGQISQNYSITVVNGNVPVIQPIANQTITVGKDLNFTITASEADLQYPLTIDFTGAPTGLNSTGSGLIIGANYQFNISGVVIDQTKIYNITAIAYDKYLGASTPVNFTITVENQKPNITSTPVTNATACVDYSYDVNAIDPDSHIVEYFDSTNSLPANLIINQATGLISGQVQAQGNYNITIEARDQYYGQTIAPYSAQAGQTYALSVANEVFTVTAPNDDTIWVFANGFSPPIAYPTQYNGSVSVSTSNTVTYKLSTTASPIPAGTVSLTPSFFLTIDSNGIIQGTPTDSAVDPGTYTITVTAINACGASYSDDFKITVLSFDEDKDGFIDIIYGGDDCYDGQEGADGILGTLDDGVNINPSQPDDCTQYDGIDNDCDGLIDNHANTSNVLTNTDFELGPVGGFPANWSGGAQSRAYVGITQAEAKSGIQSILIKQDANLPWPGTCTQALCASNPFGCTWLAATNQCSFPKSDLCHATAPSIYNQGETFCWQNSNNVMWGYLTYNASPLPFQVGKTYLVRYYYKGNPDFNGAIRASLSYNPGWQSQCFPLSWTWLNCAAYAFGATCANDPTSCCLHAKSIANQTECYSAVGFSAVADGNYPNWTLYSSSFVYTADLTKLLDDLGNITHLYGISFGYNSTGPLGSNIYIDDFQLLECVNIP